MRSCVADRLPDHPLGQPLDHGGDAGRAEALVELAPADDAVGGRQLDEVVVAPAGIAMKGLERHDLHRGSPTRVSSRPTVRSFWRRGNPSVTTAARPRRGKARSARHCGRPPAGHAIMRGLSTHVYAPLTIALGNCALPFSRRSRPQMHEPRMEQTAPGSTGPRGERPVPTPAPLPHAELPALDVVASITDTVVAVDDSWRCIYANPAAEQLLDRRADALVGESILPMLDFGPDGLQAALTASKLNETPVAFSFHCEPLGKWLEISGAPCRGGYLIFSRDVGDLRRVSRAAAEGAARAREDRLDQSAHFRHVARPDPGRRPRRAPHPRQPQLPGDSRLRSRGAGRAQRRPVSLPRRPGGHAQGDAAGASRRLDPPVRLPLRPQERPCRDAARGPASGRNRISSISSSAAT